MSANQIPGKFPTVRLGHSCPKCFKNGGPGHTLEEIAAITGMVVIKRGDETLRLRV